MRKQEGGRATSSGSYKWLVVGMLWFVCFFNYADRQAIFSVFPLLKSQLRMTDLQLGMVGTSFMWAYALFGPLAGWLCDRLPRKTMVLGGLLFWSLVTASTALAHSYGELLLCRALGGLGEAFYFPASMSMLSDYHGADTRSRAMSLHQSSVYAGSIAGGVLSGFIGQYHGWRASFALFGLLGIVLGVVLWGFLREPVRGMSDDVAPSRQSSGSLLHELKDVLGSRLVWMLIAAFMGANFVAVIFLTWTPSFLYRKFHMSLAMAGMNGTAYLQIASVAGVISGGLLADALRKKRRSGRILTQALGLICGVPFLFLTGWTLSVPVLILAMIGFGYFKGIYDANIFASLYDVVATERRGAAAGIMNSLGWLGGGIAPVAIAAASYKFGMSACLSATAAIYLSLGLLLFLIARKMQKPVAPRLLDLHSQRTS
ncbi:MAG: spinster family MFS transporter [Acidobacteriaceae bacterium]